MTYTKVIIAYMLGMYNQPLESESSNLLLSRCNAYIFNLIFWLAEGNGRALNGWLDGCWDQLRRQGDREAQRAKEKKFPTSK